MTEHADKLIETVARAGTALAINATVGGLPIGNVVVEVARSRIGDNDKALQEALVQDLLGDVLTLNRYVDEIRAFMKLAGRDVEDIRTMRVIAILEEFLRSMLDAASEEKRSALIHAAAHQFDPDFGPQDVRRYWLGLVRSLSDLEIRLVRMLGQYHMVTFAADSFTAIDAGRRATVHKLPMEEAAALKAVLSKFAERPERFVANADANFTNDRGQAVITKLPALTQSGMAILKFIEWPPR